MRGEHGHTRPHNQGRQGSSPHARGAPATALVVGHVKGIIPACAGSTSRSSRRHATPWDHPRMRGEHRVRWSIKDSHEGSSPHARGALISSQNGNDSTGIIPACAGSTEPRISNDDAEAGSSPHARGAHLNTCVFAQDSSESHSLYQSHQRRASGQINTPMTSSCPALSGPHGDVSRQRADPPAVLHPTFRPSRRHCRAGCGPIPCLTLRTS